MFAVIVAPVHPEAGELDPRMGLHRHDFRIIPTSMGMDFSLGSLSREHKLCRRAERRFGRYV
jgi:hypothetical protein